MKLFEGHKNVDSVQSFWKYAEGDLLHKMYCDFDYGAESGKYECPTKGETSIGPCRITREDRNILYDHLFNTILTKDARVETRVSHLE